MKLGLKVDIQGILSLGSWHKNTAFKPTFIREMLDRHPDHNIVFVDCDAEVLTYPNLFENIPDEFNFGAYTLDRGEWYRQGSTEKELLSGTLFIRNNQESRRVVDQWIDKCKTSRMWEQRVLQDLIQETGVPVFALPLSYCYIATMPNGDEPFVSCPNVVIRHNQVSRKYRHLV
jgi:hypothetical protein